MSVVISIQTAGELGCVPWCLKLNHCVCIRFIMWHNWTYMQEEMCGFIGVIYVHEMDFLRF